MLVLERRELVGGACVTEEVFPGYRVSTAAYLVSLMQERVVRELNLRRFGYEVLPKDPAYFAPSLDGRHMFMYADQARTLATHLIAAADLSDEIDPATQSLDIPAPGMPSMPTT